MPRKGENFTVVGIVFPTSDGPGLGTPIFRHATNSGYFVQDYNMAKSDEIQGFIKVHAGALRGMVTYLSNRISSELQSLQYAVRICDGTIFVGSNGELQQFVENNEAEVKKSPFLVFHLSHIIEGRHWLLFALQDPAVVTAVAKGTIAFRKSSRKNKSVLWDDLSIEILKCLWNGGVSAQQIGKAVGASREAVIGKVHRLGLESRSSIQ